MWPWEWDLSSSPEAIVALWIGLAAAVIALWGILTQRALTRRQTTLNTLSELESDKDLIEARQRFVKLTRNAAALVSLADDAPFRGNKKVDPEIEANMQAIRLVFNHWELIAIGMQFKSIDFHMVKRYARGQIINDWGDVAPLIFALRKKYSQPAMYHEIEELARSLRDNNMPRRRRILGLWW